jgi:formate/nitrite transporter FocA (FNT family)
MDIIILATMAGACVVAGGAFAAIVKYLFDRELADRHATTPNIVDFYKSYIAHTRKTTGQIGRAFWVHSIAAGVFITTGVVYTILRFILPRIL